MVLTGGRRIFPAEASDLCNENPKVVPIEVTTLALALD